MFVNFEKVPYEEFLAQSKTCGFVDDWTNDELIYAVWAKLKPPEKKLGYYCIYSPWSFYLKEGKHMQLPTGYKAVSNDIMLEPRTSSNFIYENKIKNNKHIILKLAAKRNVCICEGDTIVSCDLTLE